MAGVKVNISTEKILSRFGGRISKGLLALKGQIAADTAPYVPRVTGDLEHSVKPSDTTSDPFLRWNIPYARRQYYGQFQHSKQAHPRATRLWFNVAKGVNRDRWKRVADRAIKS
jgi:hypothetical protein